MQTQKTKICHTYGSVNWENVHGKAIIGYDKRFWEHCLEKDRQWVSGLLRTERRKKNALLMRCDRDHVFKMVPYTYFVERRECPHCIRKNEKGAINIDEMIVSFWDDDRYLLEDISESSLEVYKFKCPFCGKCFQARMIDMVNQIPKCVACCDGNTLNGSSKWEDNLPYMIRSKIYRRINNKG